MSPSDGRARSSRSFPRRRLADLVSFLNRRAADGSISWRALALAASWLECQTEHPVRLLATIVGIAAPLAVWIGTYWLAPLKISVRIYPLEIASPFAGQPTSLDADRSGRYVVTAGASRAMTIWFRESQDHWKPTVIRAPRRAEFAWARYRAAITPNAEYLAFSAPPLANKRNGYEPGTARIYIFDRAERRLVATFNANIPTYVTRLRFSPDGKYLAALLSGGCGLRIWSSTQWSKADNDPSPKFSDDEGYAGSAGVSECCTPVELEACEELPRGTDIAFDNELTRGTGYLRCRPLVLRLIRGQTSI